MTTKRPARERSTLRPTTAAGNLASVTRQIIALQPGARVDLTPADGNLAAERARMASRIRTARLTTGRRYSTLTQGARLYVMCDEET